MKIRCLAGGVLGVLLVCGVGALFLFPLGPTATEAPYEHGHNEQFASSGAISVDGELLVDHDATVLDPETAHVTLEFQRASTEYVYEDGAVYTKHVTTTDEDSESIQASLQTDGEVVYYGDHGNRTVLVTEGQGTYDDGHLRFVRTTTVRSVILPAYEQVSDGSDGEHAVYEPTSAWVRSDGSLTRVDPEAGAVRTDPETGLLRSASLEASLTQTSSWGRYLLQREPDGSIHVEYEYDPDPDPTAFEPPDWIEQCVRNGPCEF